MKSPTLFALLLLGISCGHRELNRVQFNNELGQSLPIVEYTCCYEGRECDFDFFQIQNLVTKSAVKLPIADSPVTLPFPRGSRAAVPLDQVALTKITASRQPMDAIVATSCRALTAEEVGPHALAEYEIFVNRKAEQPILNSRRNHFSIGAVFLKTKYHSGAAAPHLATQMTKLADSGQASDWKYEVFELPSGRPLPCDAQKCLRCHQDWAQEDFISPDGWTALRQSQNTRFGKAQPWQVPAPPLP
ncbi:MAG: hypothetical protein RL095_3643 [Verrucomicrobiota bacterium]|jgi:hypothetical protein